MKRKRGWLLYPLIILAVVLCAVPAFAVPAFADTPTKLPSIPHAFYGTLTMGGSDAPVGTVVTAKVGGVQCGSITTTVAGQYGGSGAFDAKLTVTGEIATGATISFFVNDVDTTQTYAFSPGGVTELNLTVTPPDDTTAPSVVITALTPDPTSNSTPTLTGTATDTESNISSVEYKVDAGSWTAATASDGAFDSLSEGYTFTTAALADGAHTVYVRATDAASNTTAEADYASDGFTVAPTGAPSVSATSPAAGATDVALDAVVTATFSTAMDPSTITTSSFALTSDRAAVSGSVSYDSSTNIATFTPDANLDAGATYTVTLSASITSVVPGDANGDGSVNALDITKVERVIAGLDTSTLGADANDDSAVNALDITKVERVIAGLDATAGTSLAAEYSWSFTAVQ